MCGGGAVWRLDQILVINIVQLLLHRDILLKMNVSLYINNKAWNKLSFLA